MADISHIDARCHLRRLRAIALALILTACGGSPAPPPTLPGGYTPRPSSALPMPTATATTPALGTPVGGPTSPVTIAATAPTAQPSAVATGTPLVATAAAATPAAGAEMPTPKPVSTPGPGAGWLVLSLKVGPGRLYALLISTAPAEGTDNTYALLFSDDEGKTWAPFAGGLPSAGCFYDLALDYASKDSLYLGACQGGLYHWGGGAWALISQQRVGALEVVYGNPQVMWSTDPQPAANAPCVSRSEDGGATWVAADAGLIARWGVRRLGIDPRDSNTLYAAVPWLYRGTADGQWKLITASDPLLDGANGIAIEGGTGALYVSLGAPNQILRSLNANAADVTTIHWEVVHDFGESQAVQLLATGPSPSGLALYANLATVQQLQGGGTSLGDYLPYCSPNGGATWERIVMPGWIE